MSDCSGSEAGWAIGMFILGTAFGAALVHYRACPRLSTRLHFKRAPFERPTEEELYSKLTEFSDDPQFSEGNRNDGYPDTASHSYQEFDPYEDPKKYRENNSYVDVAPNPPNARDEISHYDRAASVAMQRPNSYIEVGPEHRHSSSAARDQKYVDSQYISQSPDAMLGGDGYMQVNYDEQEYGNNSYGANRGGVDYTIDESDDEDYMKR